MSTKTIAVESRVYERLAQAKREGESFSKAIDRLLEEVGSAHTGREILRSLQQIPPLPEKDAEAMLAVIEENRAGEAWDGHDLR
jgi:predicted CopG family antitoxin